MNPKIGDKIWVITSSVPWNGGEKKEHFGQIVGFGPEGVRIGLAGGEEISLPFVNIERIGIIARKITVSEKVFKVVGAVLRTVFAVIVWIVATLFVVILWTIEKMLVRKRRR